MRETRIELAGKTIHCVMPDHAPEALVIRVEGSASIMPWFPSLGPGEFPMFYLTETSEDFVFGHKVRDTSAAGTCHTLLE